MKIPRFVQWILIVPWLSVALTAFAHGPNRGLNGGVVSTVSMLLASACFVVAVLAFRKSRRVAVIILAIGLVARCVYEVCRSVGKIWAVQSPFVGEGTLYMTVYYLLSFIIPAMMLCDWWRERKAKAQVAQHDGFDF